MQHNKLHFRFTYLNTFVNLVMYIVNPGRLYRIIYKLLFQCDIRLIYNCTSNFQPHSISNTWYKVILNEKKCLTSRKYYFTAILIVKIYIY